MLHYPPPFLFYFNYHLPVCVGYVTHNYNIIQNFQ